MKCMYCGCLESRVIDSRPTEDGTAIRRRRECTACARRFTSYEKLEMTPVYIVKKDGRREPFDPAKVRSGIIKACGKRPVALSQVDEAVADIERAVANLLEQEITTDKVASMVMKRLKKLDEVAYVRFASVYRQFHDINSFMAELRTLMEDEDTRAALKPEGTQPPEA